MEELNHKPLPGIRPRCFCYVPENLYCYKKSKEDESPN